MLTELTIFKNILISILLEAIPFVLIGVVLAALLQMFVSEQTVRKWMPKHPVLGILFGTALGMLFPICECGMIPVIRRLLQKGMPVYIAIVFVISGPILNPVVFFSTYMAFRAQPEMAYARMGLAFLVAVVIGWIILRTVKKSPLKHSLDQMALAVSPIGVPTFQESTVAPHEPAQPPHVTIAARSEDHDEDWHVIGDSVASVREVDGAEERTLTLNEHLAGLDENTFEEEQVIEESMPQVETVAETELVAETETVAETQVEVTESERDALIGWSASTKMEKSYWDVITSRMQHTAAYAKRFFSKQKWDVARSRFLRFDWSKRGSELFTHASLEFFEMGKYLVLGCLITATVHTFVSRDILVSIGDGAVGSHLFMMAFAYILSICSTSDAFVASSFAMTFSGGSLLAFLVFGPMLDLKTTLMMLAVFRAKFVFFLMLLITVTVFIGSLIVGALVF